MPVRTYNTRPGHPRPFGAQPAEGGVNFAVFSRNATAVTLCLFERPEDETAAQEIRLDPRQNRTGDIWHIFVEGLEADALYLYRADGPFMPERGYRFNPHKVLLDPYAKALTDDTTWDISRARAYDPSSPKADLSFSEENDAAFMPKNVVVDDEFDWGGDRPLNYPLRHCVIYEAHVRGLTAHESSGVAHPGTYQGLTEVVPRLKSLGVTSLELLPVQEFDSLDNPRLNPSTGQPLRQYWGYNTLAFFAPKNSYAASRALNGPVVEFKEMVKALHRAGIELILDVVFNHTGEGNELGPTVSFRGFDNTIWYMLDENPRYYKNFSGCGNTLNCNHPVVRNFILDCLHYWVVDMHVDGFRFDLGSILGRDPKGRLLENPPVIEQIAEDPILRQTKIIAEAWDAGGAYQVGSFPGGRWAEWNDRFRDDVRKFWRGDRQEVRCFCTRITGSSDLYLRDGRKPFHSINYVTSHDGFTLWDLVSYSTKRNQDNGENDADGHNANFSCGYGADGPTDDTEILAVRRQTAKNFLATLLLSIGTPMLLAGDEALRTQNGNNNAYCQDNPVSWIDWTTWTRNEDLVRFVRGLIAFRLRHPAFRRPEFYTGKDANYNAIPDISWYDPSGKAPDWARIDRTIAARIDGSRADIVADRDDNDFFMMFNASESPITFHICAPPPNHRWYVSLDTSLHSPDDMREPGGETILIPQGTYRLAPRSMALLLAKEPEQGY